MFAYLEVFVSLVLQSQDSSVILLLLLCAVRFAGRRQGLRGHETVYCEVGIERRGKDGVGPSLPPADIRLTRLSCTPCRYWMGSKDGIKVSLLLWDPTM